VADDTDQLNVLIIDDDPSIRRLLVEIVARQEHQAVPATTAEEGLELLPFWTFQVAFIDHNLPGMEGLVLGEYLRRNNPDMTIALVTAEGDFRLERRSRDLNIAFIPKPFEVRDILQVIEDYLDGAREREQRRRARQDEGFAPPIAEYVEELAAAFAVPNVPARVEARLTETIKRCLNDLRSVGRYTERDRVVALSGLLAARLLGVRLPRASSGRTLYEEYDQLMRERGRRTEFEPP
jgi:DNA-binding response OmpR family regulator